jgi:Na+/H+ antiporter NhaD/arsenite permease-like protein
MDFFKSFAIVIGILIITCQLLFKQLDNMFLPTLCGLLAVLWLDFILYRVVKRRRDINETIEAISVIARKAERWYKATK